MAESDNSWEEHSIDEEELYQDHFGLWASTGRIPEKERTHVHCTTRATVLHGFCFLRYDVAIFSLLNSAASGQFAFSFQKLDIRPSRRFRQITHFLGRNQIFLFYNLQFITN